MGVAVIGDARVSSEKQDHVGAMAHGHEPEAPEPDERARWKKRNGGLHLRAELGDGRHAVPPYLARQLSAL